MCKLTKNMVLQYPIPMKKETQGRTDVYIGSWLKSQPRDKVFTWTSESYNVALGF